MALAVLPASLFQIVSRALLQCLGEGRRSQIDALIATLENRLAGTPVEAINGEIYR